IARLSRPAPLRCELRLLPEPPGEASGTAPRAAPIQQPRAPVQREGGQSPTIDDVETERRQMELPLGFEIQLVAWEPDVVNPVAMNFDTQGRLWVACAPRYPQVLPSQEPADYIVVLDDFAHTGKARSVRVFADGLTMPTGLTPGDGGVYVSQGDS